jgi:glycosyltransferase involved in cell wall biosynthesis
MKIAQIAPIFFPVPPTGYGGAELVVSVLANGLVECGHDVVLFASGDSGTFARLDPSIAQHSTLADFSQSLSDEIYHETYAYLRATDADIIHDHGWFGPSLAAIRGSGPPVVHTLHGAWSPGLRRQHAMVGGRIHRVAVSRSQAENNKDVKYAAIIHHGLPLAQFPPPGEKEDYLVFVGRATPEKGSHTAVEVAKRANKRLIMIIKRSEPDERDYWTRHVEPRLTGLEVIVDVPSPAVRIELVSRAAGLLFPIDWAEPFGLVMIEAMACGTPVVAMNRGSVPEVVISDKTGFICNDIDEMVSAVSRLPSISPEFCRQHIQRNFSSGHMIGRYERLFEQILAKKR